MATLPSSDSHDIRTRLEPADVIAFPKSSQRSGAKLEDALSMCVGYMSLAGFVSGLALLLMR